MRKRLLATAFVLLALLFGGCVSAGNNGESVVVAMPTPEATPKSTPALSAGATASDARIPLERREETYKEENVAIYPAAVGEGHEALNKSIYADILAGFDGLESYAYTFFSIKYNRRGMLSLIVSYYDMETNELLLVTPETYDVTTGEHLPINAFFGTTSERWRTVLPDIISKQAEAKGLTLLSDILPIADEQLYYVTSESLVIVYRRYEISTYSAGWPEFSVSISDISYLLGTDGLGARLLEKEE